ncbi:MULTISPECIES: LysR family transcriptional regulator [Lysobacter]|uniref:HTH-type transcriptional regulator CysB n=2 Tax=Lysobacter TaxID=68 RepID=A0A0S2DE56_LYSEN|nr:MULTISPECIES: LysR family transcriptional regulator [Lysobacter]ALN56589.1 HTH-type transcriptional regulator CysB [Lysobacter enzymogenes]QQQ00109.1 LysR family transcriptional regulator [Lysobacter enzymogenes]ROU04981.1 LysR family transcriptional regulator [Lysobacter enzymogenes]UZW59555.1 LysR family transcriptional regulator [Lysobacter enzymogenes]WMT03390.1 LysR family transcriptional regulator [Lysobacter yananisis]
MTLTQLRYLVAIADSGLNITLAAERVHATQPGLSKQLKQLEDELGFLLFVRKGRSLEAIAPAGERVLAHARRILEEAANIRAYAANERGQHAGRLVLSTTHTQARYVLPPAIAQVKRDFPQVSVHLQAAADGEVLAHLSHGNADLAVISTAGAPPEGGLAVPLFRWRRVVLVPRAHPLAKLDRAPTLAELAAQPLISYESSTRPESSLRRAFAAGGHEPQLAMTARDADLIKTYVRTGLGVGLLAEMAVTSRDDDLKALTAPDAVPECITWAVIPRARVLRDYALELVHGLAPQIDRRDLRRVLEGNLEPAWPKAPSWIELTQSISS